MKRLAPSSAGFTVVEIVVTIVIIGILSAFVMSRFLSTDSFNAPVLRDQLIAMIRSAQQSALGRPGVILTVTPNASNSSAVISTVEDGGGIDSVTMDIESVTISTDLNTTASCGVTPGASTVSNSSPLELNFGELGDLIDSGITGSTGPVNSALRICLNNNPVNSVCVSPSGFAYAGDCDV